MMLAVTMMKGSISIIMETYVEGVARVKYSSSLNAYV